MDGTQMPCHFVVALRLHSAPQGTLIARRDRFICSSARLFDRSCTQTCEAPKPCQQRSVLLSGSFSEFTKVIDHGRKLLSVTTWDYC